MCMRALVHAACTLATLVAIDLAACSAAGVVGAMQRPPGPRAHRCALRIPAQSAGAQPPIRLAARSLCICSQGAPRRSHHHPPSVSLLATATVSERWLHYLTTAPRSASTMPPNRWYRPTKPETGVPRSLRRAPHFCGTFGTRVLLFQSFLLLPVLSRCLCTDILLMPSVVALDFAAPSYTKRTLRLAVTEYVEASNRWWLLNKLQRCIGPLPPIPPPPSAARTATRATYAWRWRGATDGVRRAAPRPTKTLVAQALPSVARESRRNRLCNYQK
eukprot:SAG25_NODE_157_length_13480_cov_7.481653_4_plen_274_part_00